MRTLALLLVLATTPALAATPTAAPLVNKVQRFYEASRDLHAHFEQTLQSSLGGEKHASGELWLKKPGKMRWDYATPEKKLMVSDGKTLWVYQPEDEQAFKQELSSSSLPVSVSFLLGQGKLASEFEVTLDHPAAIGGAGETVLKLVPKAATTAYRYLLFVVDSATGLVRETVIYDQQGGTNHLVFSNVQTNHGIADSKFQFAPPHGTQIISAH